LADILNKVSAAAEEFKDDWSVTLVFDEQLAELETAISIRRFVSGVKLPNVSHYPLMGVSHVSPGVQLADIGAYVIGRRAADPRFEKWLRMVRNLEWTGKVDGRNRPGIQRWDYSTDGKVTVRQKWE
jgi:hypothetical protein